MSISLILGDLHLGKGISIGKPGIGTGLNSRIIDQINILDWVLNTSIDKNVSNIIITGDIFEDPKPSPSYIAIFIDWLRRVSDNDISVHIIYGNHDILRSGQFYSSALDLIEKTLLDNVYTYNNITTINYNDVSFTFLPFRDRKSFNTDSNKEALSLLKDKMPYHLAEIPINNVKVCIGHFTLEGALYVGDEISDMSNELVLPVQMFEKYDYTFMGHIHKPQELSSNPHISHIGSMDLSDFKESDHIKHIALLDSESKSLSYIDIPTRPLTAISLEIPSEIEEVDQYILDYLNINFTKNLERSILRLNIIHLNQSKNINRKLLEEDLYKMKVHHIYKISEERKIKQIKNDLGEDDIIHSMGEMMAINKWALLNIDEKDQNNFISLACSIVESCTDK